MQNICRLAAIVRDGGGLGDVEHAHSVSKSRKLHLKVIGSTFLRHVQCFNGCYLCDSWRYYIVC